MVDQEWISVHPVRRFPSWQGKRNYDGSWWSSTTRGFVDFESLLEREAIMMSDFDGEVSWILSQPFALLWPRQSKLRAGQGADTGLERREDMAAVNALANAMVAGFAVDGYASPRRAGAAFRRGT